MLVLFINCHKKTEQGQLRFRNFYKNIRSLLESTVYYGNDVTETIREYDNLEDYIYDQISFRIDERIKRKFESLEYVFVDGTCSFAPWNQQMDNVRLIIRKSIEDGKKLLCHGFGHFSAYYYLTTKFDKPYKIGKESSKKVDFEWDEQSGDLKLKGLRVCNSGVKITNISRPFSDKSSHALAKGITLSSKFDYVLFDGKSGSKLLKNVSVPFSFYWKSKLFCTSKTVSQAKADVLLETQNGAPIVFTHKQLLSVQGLCPQILKMIRNWFMEHTNRVFHNDDTAISKAYQTIAFQNKMQYRKALSSSASQLRPSSKITIRPQSSKFSTLDFQKPIVRCSGKYETLNERYLKEQLQKKSLNFGRSRMIFKGKLNELEIANYVQREPSRPPSNYKFREVQKDKWVGSRDFLNC